jgi:ubiquinone/menaquinone biosynthesis C-methylase UbiE
MNESLSHEAYSELAEIYAKRVYNKPHNAFYDRPGVQALLKDLDNKKVLDAGCGTGVYTEWLITKGCKVTGIDANNRMLQFAIDKIKNNAVFIHANLEEPLDFFENEIFDGVISPLTITYCKHLEKVFSEFSRILKPNGWFVFSTEHPFFSYNYNKIGNYYKTKEVKCIWTGFDKPVEMKSYYHSLSTITEALSNNKFIIERITESLPTKDFQESDPEGYQKLINFPMFIFIRAVKIT